MNKFLLPLCCLFLLSLTGCGTIAGGIGGVIDNVMTPTSVTIDGVTYRSGFYGDLFPLFGQVGQIGSETLGDEILYDDGLHKFKRVEFEGHDWVHSYVGGTTGGTVYCAESEWEQTHDYYADSANFIYYCGGKPYTSEEGDEYPQIDAQKFDELFAFGEEYDYKPFDERSNERAMQIAYRLPEEAFEKGLKFTKASNDGYFKVGGSHEYFVHDDKLILVFYHDGGRDNGGIKEVVAIDVPDELGQYFIDLMERYLS